MSILVGLTGNIGAGKSLAASFFNELGAFIIDADLISRELVVPYNPAWKEIVDHFGEIYLNFDKTLNRSKLAVEVFKNDKKRKILEGILHYRVIAEEKKIYSDYQKIDPEAVVVIDSPLLIETQNYKIVDKVVIIKSTPKQQIQRVMNHSIESRQMAQNRLKAQMSLEKKLGYADYVLRNTGSRDVLKSQVHLLYSKLKSLT
jgi:dephospho-CoA kinase